MKPPSPRTPGEYEIVAGERRWRAATMGRFELRAEVRELTDLDVVRIQILENLHREEVHPLEEADQWPAVQQYLDMVEQYVPDGITGPMGIQSLSSWLLSVARVSCLPSRCSLSLHTPLFCTCLYLSGPLVSTLSFPGL